MPVGVKVIFTIWATLWLAVFILFVRRGDRGARDAHWWRGGENDLARWLVMRRDGTFRRYTKAMTVVITAVFLAVIWLAL